MKDKLDELLAELHDAADEKFLADIEVPEGLEQRLEKQILSFEKRIGYRRYAIAACASLILVLSVSLHFLFQPEQEFVFKDTCKTPEEAEMQLARALTMLNTHSTKKLNEAREQISRVAAQPDYTKYISFE